MSRVLKRIHKVVSEEETECFLLNRQIYEDLIVKEYPDINRNINELALKRLRILNKSENELDIFLANNKEFLELEPRLEMFENIQKELLTNIENNQYVMSPKRKVSINKTKMEVKEEDGDSLNVSSIRDDNLRKVKFEQDVLG